MGRLFQCVSGFVPVAETAEYDRQVRKYLWVMGHDGVRFLQTFKRRSQLPSGTERHAQQVPGVGIEWILFQNLTVHLLGAVQLSRLLQTQCLSNQRLQESR